MPRVLEAGALFAAQRVLATPPVADTEPPTTAPDGRPKPQLGPAAAGAPEKTDLGARSSSPDNDDDVEPLVVQEGFGAHCARFGGGDGAHGSFLCACADGTIRHFSIRGSGGSAGREGEELRRARGGDDGFRADPTRFDEAWHCSDVFFVESREVFDVRAAVVLEPADAAAAAAGERAEQGQEPHTPNEERRRSRVIGKEASPQSPQRSSRASFGSPQTYTEPVVGGQGQGDAANSGSSVLVAPRSQLFILTIESENPGSLIQCARVYFFSECLDAGHVADGGPGNGRLCRPRSQILSMPRSVSAIATCTQHTGRIAVGTRTAISLWTLSLLEGTECPHRLADIALESVPSPQLELALFGEYVAYCAANEVQVLHVGMITPQDQDANDAAAASEAAREAEKSTNLSNVSAAFDGGSAFDHKVHDDPAGLCEVIFSVDDGAPTEPGEIVSEDSHKTAQILLRTVIAQNASSRSKSSSARLAAGENFENLGPIVDTQHTIESFDEDRNFTHSFVCVLHRKFKSDNLVHSLCLIPEVSLDSNETVLVRAFFSVSNERRGYLYSLGNPRTPSTHLASYMYADAVESLCVSSSDVTLPRRVCAPVLVQAVSEQGLETWTVRGSDTVLGQHEVNFPDPCLLGMRPFIGLRKVCAAGFSVVGSLGPTLEACGWVALCCRFSQEETPKKARGRSRKPVARKSSFFGNLFGGKGSNEEKADEANDDKAPEESLRGWCLYVLRGASLRELAAQLSEPVSPADVASVDGADLGRSEAYQRLLENYFLLTEHLTSTRPPTALRDELASDFQHISATLGAFFFNAKKYVEAAKCLAQSVNFAPAANQASEFDRLLTSFLDLVSSHAGSPSSIVSHCEAAVTTFLVDTLNTQLNVAQQVSHLSHSQDSWSHRAKRIRSTTSVVTHRLNVPMERANSILQHISVHSPSDLAEILISGKLSGFDAEFAANLLFSKITALDNDFVPNLNFDGRFSSQKLSTVEKLKMQHFHRQIDVLAFVYLHLKNMSGSKEDGERRIHKSLSELCDAEFVCEFLASNNFEVFGGSVFSTMGGVDVSAKFSEAVARSGTNCWILVESLAGALSEESVGGLLANEESGLLRIAAFVRKLLTSTNTEQFDENPVRFESKLMGIVLCEFLVARFSAPDLIDSRADILGLLLESLWASYVQFLSRLVAGEEIFPQDYSPTSNIVRDRWLRFHMHFADSLGCSSFYTTEIDYAGYVNMFPPMTRRRFGSSRRKLTGVGYSEMVTPQMLDVPLYVRHTIHVACLLRTIWGARSGSPDDTVLLPLLETWCTGVSADVRGQLSARDDGQSASTPAPGLNPNLASTLVVVTSLRPSLIECDEILDVLTEAADVVVAAARAPKSPFANFRGVDVATVIRKWADAHLSEADRDGADLGLTWRGVVSALMLRKTRTTELRALLSHAAISLPYEVFLRMCTEAWPNAPASFFMPFLELCVQTKNSESVRAALGRVEEGGVFELLESSVRSEM
jgi:hypothetical protein